MTFIRGKSAYNVLGLGTGCRTKWRHLWGQRKEGKYLPISDILRRKKIKISDILLTWVFS